MPSYEISIDAEKDLQEISRYTLNQWGKKTLQDYQGGLKQTFNTIGNGAAQARAFSASFPQLLVTKYKYHYVFYLSENRKKPIIIGVIHERRDIVNRLSGRLNTIKKEKPNLTK